MLTFKVRGWHNEGETMEHQSGLDKDKSVDLNETELAELQNEATQRQRVKTDLGEFDGALRKMMEVDISLPLMLGWLEKKGKTTTLPALRRYVRKTFGEEFYQEFTTRNGWQKSKRGVKAQTSNRSDENFGRRATDVAGKKDGDPATQGLMDGKKVGKDDGNIFNAVAKEMAAIEESKDPRRN